MRNKYNITKSDIKHCFRMKMKVSEIANYYGCSKSFVYNLCKKYEIPIPSLNLVGEKFHMLTVIKKLGSKGDKGKQSIFWLCQCECGNFKELPTKSLTRKEYKSCGCWMKTKEYSRSNHCWNGYKDIHGKWWGNIKRGAKKRGHKFDIDIEYAWEIYEKQNKKCAISGIDISFANSAKTFPNTTASIDRIDSSVGYVKNNIQWVHKEVNLMKQGLSMDEFLNWIKIIGDNITK